METFLYILSGLIIIFLILASGVFSFSEMAFANLSKIRIKTIQKNTFKKKEKKKTERVLFLRERYNKTSTSIVITNNIVNILATTLSAALFTSLVGDGVGLVVSTIIMSIFVITFGEIIPKLYAKKHPEAGAMFFSRLILITYQVFYPITSLISKFIKEEEDTVFKTEEELREGLMESKEKGIIDKDENELIKNTLMFDKSLVNEVMQPLKEVIYIRSDIKEEDLEAIIKQYGFSRIPVVNEKENVIGIFNLKTFFFKSIGNESLSFKEIFEASISEPIFVQKNENIKRVFELLKSKRKTIAIVREKRNDLKLFGIITMEDILEEIVGEIYDENDIENNGIYEIGLETIEVSSWAKTNDIFKDYFPQLNLSEDEKELEFGEWIIKNSKNEEALTQEEFFNKNKFFHFKNLIIWVKKNKNGDIFFEVDLIE